MKLSCCLQVSMWDWISTRELINTMEYFFCKFPDLSRKKGYCYLGKKVTTEQNWSCFAHLNINLVLRSWITIIWIDKFFYTMTCSSKLILVWTYHWSCKLENFQSPPSTYLWNKGRSQHEKFQPLDPQNEDLLNRVLSQHTLSFAHSQPLDISHSNTWQKNNLCDSIFY